MLVVICSILHGFWHLVVCLASESRRHLVLACCLRPCLDLWSFFSWSLCWCPWPILSQIPEFELPPVITLLFEGHFTPRAMLIWVFCASTRGHDDIWSKLLSQAMCGFMVLEQPESLLMSAFSVTTEAMLMNVFWADIWVYVSVWVPHCPHGHANMDCLWWLWCCSVWLYLSFCGPAAASVWVGNHGSWYHGRLRKCLGSGLSPEAMWWSEDDV